MHPSVSRRFPPADRDRIASAVREAEKRTSGEIVPYVVAHSDHYEEAEWRAGVLLGALTFTALVVIQKFTNIWLQLDLAWAGITALGAGAVGMLLVKFIPAMKRFFAGHAMIELRVSQRAAEAFITEEVFHTHNRTGVLIFVSLLERRVLVVGDSGINAKVRKEDWHGIVHTVVASIREGKTADGIIEAVRKCGALLEKHGLHHLRSDKDELPDSLRMSDN